MTVLVTGGLGFIGSHTVLQVVAAGREVVVVDNLVNSSLEALTRMTELAGVDISFVQADVADRAAVDRVVRENGVDEVIHFAGLKAVGESVANPLRYYSHNLGSTLALLQVLDAAGVRRFVFSSSATVYGPNAPVPAPESSPTSATNPYGWTKVMLEQVLRDLAQSDPTWRIAILRYFNPVGAHPSGRIGENPSGMPNNLLPYISQVAVGRLPEVTIFGEDYPTTDGTGVRDFIHIEDLAAGHVHALAHVAHTDSPVSTFNLGTGAGTSVRELLTAFEKASGRPVPVRIAPRRPGDVAISVADPTRANRELGWHAEKSLDDICTDTWRWQSQNPDGYA